MKKLFVFAMAIATAYASNNAEATAKLKMQARPPATCAEGRAFALLGPINPKSVYTNAVSIGNESTMYAQIGGGSAVATLLFGPIGAAANMAAIHNKTTSQTGEINKDLIVDPFVMLEQLLVAQDTGLSSLPKINITPFVVYLRPKNSELIERRVVLDIQCDGWKGRYSYHLNSMPAQKLGTEMTDQEYLDYQAHLQNAEKQLIKLFQAGIASGKFTVSEYNKISSWLLNPYFSAPLPQAVLGELEGRTVLLGGEIGKDQYLFAFMKGVHLFDASQLEIGKVWD